MNTNSLAIDVRVTGDSTPALTLHCAARNVSDRPLHVFLSRRMPYLLEEGGLLVVLHGVTPLPEDRDLNAVEIPTTRELPPGDTLVFGVSLVPLRLRSHYGDEPPGLVRHGAATLVCRVAYGFTPMNDPAHTSIGMLLAWQRFEELRVAVQLP